MRKMGLAALALLALTGCATTGGAGTGLGSKANPVRADMPQGERAYLDRLRCSDGQPPTYARIGSMGIQHSSHVMDGYDVSCASGQPGQAIVYMDMYHSGYVETQPVEGFTIVP